MVDLLDWDERARLARFKFEADRRAYLVAHALRRLVLSRCLSTGPAEIVFGEEKGGRPVIRTPTGNGLSFSLSRTREFVAFAVSGPGNLGIDVVEINKESADVNILEYYYESNILDKLTILGESEKIRQFYLYWTVLEACGKALGTGLAESLRLAAVTKGRGATVEIRLGPQIENGGKWSVFQFSPDDKHQAAIAYCGGLGPGQLSINHFFPRIDECL